MRTLSREWRLRLIAGAVFAVCAVIFTQPPIPQDPTYHDFVDTTAVAGIANFNDVASNLPVLLVGVFGLAFTSGQWRDSRCFPAPACALPWLAFFAGVALTACGSAYYHLAPDNARLVWDRAPLAVAFMALLAAVIAERIDIRAGVVFLLPLIGFGIFSVVYWSITETAGSGDLRYYAAAQFGTLIAVVLMVWLLPAPCTRGSDIYVAVLWYVLAKLLEDSDQLVFSWVSVSGHTLKHMAAAAGIFWVLRMLRRRQCRPLRAVFEVDDDGLH